MLEKRKKIKLDLSLDPTNEKLGEFNEIELDIAKATEVEYMQKVFETLGHITGDDGGVSAGGLWKAKKKIIPNDKSHNPTAVRDKEGHLICNPEGIKRVYLQEMLKRLRHRSSNPNLVQLQQMKENLCKKRIEIAKHIKSEPWTSHQLELVLKSLKMESVETQRGL